MYPHLVDRRHPESPSLFGAQWLALLANFRPATRINVSPRSVVQPQPIPLLHPLVVAALPTAAPPSTVKSPAPSVSSAFIRGQSASPCPLHNSNVINTLNESSTYPSNAPQRTNPKLSYSLCAGTNASPEPV